jgi:RND family efflux transporter MFP subunit
VKRQAWVWIVGVACIVVAASLMVGRGQAVRTSGQGKTTGRARPIPVVAAGHPRQAHLPRTLQLTASIGSLTQAVVYSKTAGYLQTVTVRAGDSVQAGQVLATVDHAQLDAQLAQAQAAYAASQTAVQTAQAGVAAAHAQTLNMVAGRQNADAQLASAQAGLIRARAQLADAQATYTRTQSLAQQGAVSQQSLDDAKSQVLSAQAGVDVALAQVRAAQAQIAQADAQIAAARQQEVAALSKVKEQQGMVANQAAVVENARLGLQYATITAPFSGVVISRQLDPGGYVTPGTSTPIMVIADVDHLDVLVNVSEPDLPAVHPGDMAQISVDSYPGRTFDGVVRRLAGGVDPATRTLQVEIDVTNPGRALRPGMYATVHLAAGNQSALVVPLSALVTVGGQHYVWVVTDGKVSQQPVTVGLATGEVVEITSGVTERDTIVTRGTDLVTEGQTVRTAPAGP